MYIQEAIWPIFILYQHCYVGCSPPPVLLSHTFTFFLFWFCWLSSTSSSSLLPTFLSCVLFFLLTHKCSSSLATILSSILLLFLAHRFSSPLPTSIRSVPFFPPYLHIAILFPSQSFYFCILLSPFLPSYSTSWLSSIIEGHLFYLVQSASLLSACSWQFIAEKPISDGECHYGCPA